MVFNSTAIILSIVAIVGSLVMIILSKSKDKNVLYSEFSCAFILLDIHVLGLVLQIMFSKTQIPPIYFDYITYIAIVFLPVIMMFIAINYININVNVKKYWYMFIIPIISLILLWTNDYHHCFYKIYSINFGEAEYGIAFIIHSIYSYALLVLSIILLTYNSIKKSGFLSKPTILIVIGSSIPLITNVLGTLKIVAISIYVTPITFIVAIVCFALAIFKYKALNITPIALQTIINTMSDAFVVISLDGTMADSNREYKENVYNYLSVNIGENFLSYLNNSKNEELYQFSKNIKKTMNENIDVVCELNLSKNNDDIIEEHYFEVKISIIQSAKRGNQNIGVLLLFNDITQHKKDMKELEEKQEIIAKQAQLVSIGELAGGVAHDINTPISAIRTGITMLKASNPERPEAEMQIIETMDNCSNKILNIVNSMRNQIRNLGGNTDTVFKISTVINDIKCITYHEVRKYKAEVEVEIEDDLSIKGDPAKLGQVLTNIVMNAAQAYKDTDGGKIKIVLMRGPQNMAITKIIDFAGGIDDNVKNNIFKSMLTTKGIEGTGLGLYLAYSVIKGNFNGEINFDTEKGEGTTFYISIPIYVEKKEND